MKYEDLVERLNMLEYHQKLLLNMIKESHLPFDQLVIKKSLKERDVEEFYRLCESLTMELNEQKAEGFVHFHPLFEQFQNRLHPNLQASEVIQSCLKQRLFLPLMEELWKYVAN